MACCNDTQQTSAIPCDNNCCPLSDIVGINCSTLNPAKKYQIFLSGASCQPVVEEYVPVELPDFPDVAIEAIPDVGSPAAPNQVTSLAVSEPTPYNFQVQFDPTDLADNTVWQTVVQTVIQQQGFDVRPVGSIDFIEFESASQQSAWIAANFLDSVTDPNTGTTYTVNSGETLISTMTSAYGNACWALAWGGQIDASGGTGPKGPEGLPLYPQGGSPGSTAGFAIPNRRGLLTMDSGSTSGGDFDMPGPYQATMSYVSDDRVGANTLRFYAPQQKVVLVKENLPTHVHGVGDLAATASQADTTTTVTHDEVPDHIHYLINEDGGDTGQKVRLKDMKPPPGDDNMEYNDDATTGYINDATTIGGQRTDGDIDYMTREGGFSANELVSTYNLSVDVTNGAITISLSGTTEDGSADGLAAQAVYTNPVGTNIQDSNAQYADSTSVMGSNQDVNLVSPVVLRLVIYKYRLNYAL